MTSPWVMTCAYSPNGRMVASGGVDNTCSLYSLRDSETANAGALALHQGYVSSCRFVSNDEVLSVRFSCLRCGSTTDADRFGRCLGDPVGHCDAETEIDPAWPPS